MNAMLKRLILTVICLLLTIQISFGQDVNSPELSVEKAEKKVNTRPPDDQEKEPFDDADIGLMVVSCVRFETEKGDIEIELFPETAPATVRNFLNLTAIGAFDTTTFSRIVPGFIIQGGSLSTGTKWNYELSLRARRKIPDEPSLIKHERGILSMARPDEPNGASTSFFILLSESEHLDGKFAAFGRVTRGMEVVELINQSEVEGEKPKEPVRIQHAVIFPCTASLDGPAPKS